MSTNTARRSRAGLFSDRFLEVFAVILLGVATVGTAWCGLQSSLWNGQQDDLTNELQAQRIEANRLFGAASQAMAYDASTLAEYARAVRADDAKTQRFYLTVLMRPQFVPFVQKWQKAVDAGDQPSNLLEDKGYVSTMRGPFQEADAKVALTSSKADSAGTTADAYLLLTVILASSLFFAGVTSSFRFPFVKVLLLSGSLACVGLAAARLVDLPIAQATADLLPNL